MSKSQDANDSENAQGMSEAASKHFVQGFARGLQVIRSFGADAPRMTLSEVAKRSNLSRASARRILLTLVDLGMAGVADRRFFLTPKVLSLGYAYLSSMPLWQFCQPILESLVAECNETCSLFVLDDTEVVYVQRIAVRRILQIGVTIGSRVPAYATSMGRVLLAGLSPTEFEAYLSNLRIVPLTHATVKTVDDLRAIVEDTRRKGYCWIDSEIEVGICGLAVPIHDSRGRVIAALNVSVSGGRTTEKKAVKQFLPLLQDAANKMHNSLLIEAHNA